jgi:hypothetical protein
LRKYIQEHAEYVGPNFAEEARKIHYGETRTATSMARRPTRKPRNWSRRASMSRRWPPDC